MPLSKDDRDNIAKLAHKSNIKSHIGWSNFTHSNQLPEALVLDIEEVDSIPLILDKINRMNSDLKPENRIILRVAAGGNQDEYSQSFSFSPCVEADIVLRLVGSEFQKIKVIDEEKNIVQVSAGVQIGALNKILYEKHNLVLPTASLIPYVTFVGLSTNAGHGSGRDQPSVSGLIRAITICRPDGKIVRVDSTHKDFELIRACHLGLFGIILNVEIECIKAKKIKRTVETKSIDELKKEISSGLLNKYPYVNIMYIPTYQKNDISNKNVFVIRLEPVPLDSKNVGKPIPERDYQQRILVNLNQKFQIGKLLAEHSNLIPYYMKYILSSFAIDEVNIATVGPWPDMFHSQTAFPRNIDNVEYLFNTNHDNGEIISAIDYTTQVLEKNAKSSLYPVVDAIFLRYLQGTNGGLSPSTHDEKKSVCGFDIVSDAKVPGFTQFKKEIQPFFINELKAKPHWGKNLPLDENYAEIYGSNLDDFVRVLTEWHNESNIKLEKSPFINHLFSYILQLPYAPKIIHSSDKKSEHKHSQASSSEDIPLEKIAEDIAHYLKSAESNKKNPAAKYFIEQLEQTQKQIRYDKFAQQSRLRFIKQLSHSDELVTQLDDHPSFKNSR